MADVGTPWGLRRLQTIVYYGELPHILSLCLLPVSLLLLIRLWEQPRARRFALAVIGFSAVALSNAFGLVTAGLASILLISVLPGRFRKFHVLLIAALFGLSYLLMCRFLPPSLIQLIRTNSQMVGGDYRFTSRAALYVIAFVIGLVAIWFVTRALSTVLRFASLFTFCFGGITVLAFWANISFIPQPHRYHHEAEMGFCLLIVFGLGTLLSRIPPRAGIAAGAILSLACVPLFWQDWQFARRLIHPADIAGSIQFKQARWIQDHLPGQRVMVSGDPEYWFNLFANNPQLSAGHEPSAPNWMQRVAVFMLYTGTNAGAQDGPLCVLWLKAFGCSAITVPGPKSREAYHPFRNPKKFDALLPVLWHDEDDTIFGVPSRSAALAHVIPSSAVVSRAPIHGLDVEPLRPYLAALDDATLPLASLEWDTPERGRIAAQIAPGQAISVQITYDPGWKANGRIRRDGLGLMIIEPNCVGNCVVNLEFTGGWERHLCSVASAIALVAVMGLLLIPALARLGHSGFQIGRGFGGASGNRA